MSGYIKLDTRAFDRAIAQKDSLVREYTAINTEYERAVSALLSNWKGKGAEAFRDDAKKVKENITGIYDILKIMCDTLTDCREVFGECDKSLGDYNRNPE